jgi:Rod binding domain-containing protein
MMRSESAMSPIAFPALPAPLSAPPRPLPGAPAFAATLDSARRTPGDAGAARVAAEQLVATTFIAPILARMRESVFAEAPFAPSAAEKRFGPFLDQHLADRIVHASRFPLVDEVARRLTAGGATPEQQAS